MSMGYNASSMKLIVISEIVKLGSSAPFPNPETGRKNYKKGLKTPALILHFSRKTTRMI